jgi:hypothetical protein
VSSSVAGGDDICNQTSKKIVPFSSQLGFIFWLLLFFYFDIIPRVNPRCTVDWIDMILYFSG